MLVGLSRPVRLEIAAASLTLALLGMHLFLAARLELTFDEAYYAQWSRHLDWGYLDHPPMVAGFIRLSTVLFGSNEFGVRALGAIVSAFGSCVIYATTYELFEDRATAAVAALLYSSMLLIGVGSIIVTPDTPLVLFWTLAIYCLARLVKSGDKRWWWLIGLFGGCALLSKYTGLLLGAGIATAMVVVPPLRRWWRTATPYMAACASLTLFLPVLFWNYQHGWASLEKQFGRVGYGAVTGKYIVEFVGAQFGLMTPFIFVLAVSGLALSVPRSQAVVPDEQETRAFLGASIAPVILYFLVHSLHDRVQGNWLAPAYPALAILAADISQRAQPMGPVMQHVMEVSRRLAIPIGLALTACVYLQAWWTPLPMRAALDPTANLSGWRQLAAKTEEVARANGANFILTSNYGLTAELLEYASGATPVIQFNQRLRWAAFDPPDSRVLLRKGIYLAEETHDFSCGLLRRFDTVQRIGGIERLRIGHSVERYVLYILERPHGEILDQMDQWHTKRPKECIK